MRIQGILKRGSSPARRFCLGATDLCNGAFPALMEIAFV